MKIEAIAKLFRATPDQVRAQFARNAIDLKADAEIAASTGKRIRGYNAEQLRVLAARCLARSKEVA